MSISRKWLLSLFRAESLADHLYHESKVYALKGLAVQAVAQFENFRDAKRACVFAARKIMCE